MLTGEAFKHVEKLRLAKDQLGAGINLVGQQIAQVPMRVVNKNLTRTACESSVDRGIDLLRHQVPGALILAITHAGLLRVYDASYAFNVGRDVDLHNLASSSATHAWAASTSE
jgi:hypothetical protein